MIGRIVSGIPLVQTISGILIFAKTNCVIGVLAVISVCSIATIAGVIGVLAVLSVCSIATIAGTLHSDPRWQLLSTHYP